MPALVAPLVTPLPRLDVVFSALADATRRAMLQRLAKGEQSIGELAAPFSMSFAGASKHVRVLEGAGLVRRRVIGRTHLCRLEAAPLAAADDWLRDYQAFWAVRLDALARELQSPELKSTELQSTEPQSPEVGESE